MALSGPLAFDGKSALVAMKLWQADVNANGGLLGRPVQLVYYDDRSNPSNVPGVYTKLLDVDKVDLVIGGYGTNMIAPAMPVAIRHGKILVGLFGLAVNSEFRYPKYFSMIPTGPNAKSAFTRGFFDVAMAQSPKPRSVAIVAADADFSRNAADGARVNANAAGLDIVYNGAYAPTTTEFSPIVLAVQATDPDLVVVCSYPLDSVGMVRAVNDAGFAPKMIGGAMVGLQTTAIKTQLGDMLNGIVNFEFWIPERSLTYPGVMDLIRRYQQGAGSGGIDPLGYHMAPWAYADLQVLGDAIRATNSLDDDKLADYMHKTTFKTVVGDVKFGSDGEWAKSRVLQIQFHGVSGHDLGQFRQADKVETILTPAQYKTGNAIYPYRAARELTSAGESTVVRH